jgi:NAD(P)-dependent dehydrogenase (short-subunit alcohol dehydrogenase family)
MRKSTDSGIRVNLSGRIALVVGGTGSIGEEISIGLLESGARVVVAGRARKTASPRLSALIRKGGALSYLRMDASAEGSVKRAAKAFFGEHGRLDILVLAQGRQKRKPFLELSGREWNEVLGANLNGTFLVCRHFLGAMARAGSGKVVGITSLASEFGIRNISATPPARQDGPVPQVRVGRAGGARRPGEHGRAGPDRTPDDGGPHGEEGLRDSNLQRIPMGQFGAPADIRGAVLFWLPTPPAT